MAEKQGMDFFGVTMAGRIQVFPTENSRGRVIDLWVGDQGEINGVGLGSLAYVSQMQTVLSLGYNAKIAIVLTPPFEEGLRFLSSGLIRFGESRIYVTFGYTTGDQRQTFDFSGFVQKPDVSIGTDITITLHGLGVGYTLGSTGGHVSNAFGENDSYAVAIHKTLTKAAESFPNEKGSEITDVQKIGSPQSVPKFEDLYEGFSEDERSGNAGDERIKSFFSSPPVSYLPKDLKSLLKNNRSEAKDTKHRVVQGPRNDWWFVKEELKNFGLDLFVQENKMVVRDMDKWYKEGSLSAPRGKKSFFLRGQVDPSLSMYPILSFSSPSTHAWVRIGLGGSKSEDIPDDKGKSTSGQGGDSDTGLAATSSYEAGGQTTTVTTSNESRPWDSGTRTGKTDFQGTDSQADVRRLQHAVKNVPGSPDSARVRARQEAEYRKDRRRQGIRGIFNTIGIPHLVPGEVVSVSGFVHREELGKGHGVFDGEYGVIEVTHSVGGSGFTTSFTGITNFLPNAIAKSLDKKDDSLTRQKLDDSDSQAATPGSRRKKTIKAGID